MASGHVNRINRPNTWRHRPATRREDFPCQLGAVHTWHFRGLAVDQVCLVSQCGSMRVLCRTDAIDPTGTCGQHGVVSAAGITTAQDGCGHRLTFPDGRVHARPRCPIVSDRCHCLCRGK